MILKADFGFESYKIYWKYVLVSSLQLLIQSITSTADACPVPLIVFAVFSR
jgi:hypothetical protein